MILAFLFMPFGYYCSQNVCVGHQWSYDHIHEYMNIMLVNIEFFTGGNKIKQRHISFVPGKPTYFIFQHVSIIYISFFRLNRILTELRRSFSYISFFSGENAR
jgi:hypothetical protein